MEEQIYLINMRSQTKRKMDDLCGYVKVKVLSVRFKAVAVKSFIEITIGTLNSIAAILRTLNSLWRTFVLTFWTRATCHCHAY